MGQRNWVAGTRLRLGRAPRALKHRTASPFCSLMRWRPENIRDGRAVAGVCNRFLGGRLVESRVTDFISYLLRAEFHSIYTNAGIAAERPRDRDVLDMRDAWTIQAVCASQSHATPARWVWFLPSFDRFRPSVRRLSRPLVRSRPVSDRDRYAILVRKFSNLISPHAHAVACMLDCWLLLIGYRFSACARLSCARRTFCAPP